MQITLHLKFMVKNYAITARKSRLIPGLLAESQPANERIQAVLLATNDFGQHLAARADELNPHGHLADGMGRTTQARIVATDAVFDAV
jgi:hypothetical protein